MIGVIRTNTYGAAMLAIKLATLELRLHNVLAARERHYSTRSAARAGWQSGGWAVDWGWGSDAKDRAGEDSLWQGF